MDKETIIYGLPKGETERYMEVILSTQTTTKAQQDQVIARATQDGWHGFRIAYFNGEKPDFLAAIGRGT